VTVTRKEPETGADSPAGEPLDDAKSLRVMEEEDGVSDGVRTRDFRSHSPALYH
jgi:hypothetical protein